MSDSIAALTGLNARAWLADPATIERAMHPVDRTPHAVHWRSLQQHADGATYRFRLVHAQSGAVIWVNEFCLPEFDAAGNLRGFSGVWVDDTRAARLEQRLAEGTWTATLAAMTGGMAHDFNNVLTGMISMSEHFLGQLPASHPFRENLTSLRDSGLGASRWIQRFGLLQQSGPGAATWHDANLLVADTLEILRHTLSRRYELSARCPSEPGPVVVGALGFQRALLVLTFRAASRMKRPGPIRLKVERSFTENGAMGPRVSVGVETPVDTKEQTQSGDGDAAVSAAARFAAQFRGSLEVDLRSPDGVTTWLHFPAANAESAATEPGNPQTEQWVLLGGGAADQLDSWADWLRKHSYRVTVAAFPEIGPLDSDDYLWSAAVIVVDSSAVGVAKKLLNQIHAARPALPVITVLPDRIDFDDEAHFGQGTTLVAAGDEQRDRLLAKIASARGVA